MTTVRYSSSHGAFAGKLAFASAQQNAVPYYLSIVRQSDGRGGWHYSPGFNSASVSDAEKYIVYAFADGYWRIQSQYRIPGEPEERLWLTLDNTGNFISCTYDIEKAGAFALAQTPILGASWKIRTATGDQQLYYSIMGDAGANVLTVNHTEGDTSALAPRLFTPSLADIRQNKQAKEADFSNVMLSGEDLQNIDFTDAIFQRAQLAGANFSDATLDRADLRETDLQGLNWGNPKSAVGIKLSGSILRGCILGNPSKRLDCREAECASADLAGAQLGNLNLSGANLKSAILSGAVFEQTYLMKATLDDVVALRARFANADLSDASAQRANFTQSRFDGTTLTRVRMGASSFLFTLDVKFADSLGQYHYPQPDLLEAFKAHGVDSLQRDAAIEIREAGKKWIIDDPAGPYKLLLKDSGIQVFNANSNLIPAILREVSCQGAHASTASFAGADLRRSRWAAAALDHSDLEDAVMTGAWLVGTDFSQANTSGADFSDTVLCQGNFTGCIAGPGASKRAISFERAHLEGVDFSKATFAGAILIDAVVGLDAGAPLLSLPLADEQYLTKNDALGALSPCFRKAGFDLGSAPTVSEFPSWLIDNSSSNDPQAPRLYEVTGNKLAIFVGGKYAFSLSSASTPLMNQPSASKQLVGLFKKNNFSLSEGAPITKETAWTITLGADATYVNSYRFMTMRVKKETTCLRIFGIAPVQLQDFHDEQVAFSATQNLQNAFSDNTVGPRGVPFSWIARGLIDGKAFWIASERDAL